MTRPCRFNGITAEAADIINRFIEFCAKNALRK